MVQMVYYINVHMNNNIPRVFKYLIYMKIKKGKYEFYYIFKEFYSIWMKKKYMYII